MRIIAITGATGGIAQEIIKHIPEDDYVIALGRDLKKLKIHYGKRSNTEYFALDMSSDVAIAETVEKIYAIHGRVDIFINNAGYGDFSDFDTYTTAQIRDMFDINTFATMTFSRLVGQRMKEAGQGHIINIASIAGLIASAKSSVYSATKFAVLGYSNALRLELKPLGISVLTVNPGPVRTDFFDIADESGHYLDSIGALSLNPEIVAEKVVKSIGTSRRELNLPEYMQLAHHLYELCPRLGDYLAGGIFNKK